MQPHPNNNNRGQQNIPEFRFETLKRLLAMVWKCTNCLLILFPIVIFLARFVIVATGQ